MHINLSQIFGRHFTFLKAHGRQERTANSSFNFRKSFVYKIPYLRARAWPMPSARASKGILHTKKAMYMGQFIVIHGPLYFSSKMRFDGKKYGSIRGRGANTKLPDMYGVRGCCRDPKHKSNLYTFVQQRGCPYFIPKHKSINGTVVHTFHNKIIKNYEKMPNFHSFYTNFYIFQ